MKKLIFVTLLSLLLSGCTTNITTNGRGGTKVEGFEDLTFGKVIDYPAPYIRKVKEATLKYKSMSMIAKEMEANGNNKSELEVKESFTVYSNNVIFATGSVKSNVTDNGVTINQGYDGEVVNLVEGNNILSYSKFLDEQHFDVDYYDEDTIQPAFDETIDELVMGALEGLTECTLYANEKETEFAFVSSDFSENFEYMLLTTDLRCNHTINRTQRVIKLNKDFSIKEVTYRHISQANVDPTTNEYHDEPITLEEEYTKIEIGYGERKPYKDTNKYLALFKDKPMLTGNYDIRFKYVEDHDTYYDDLGEYYAYTSYSTRKMTGINTMEIKGYVNLNFPNVVYQEENVQLDAIIGEIGVTAKNNYLSEEEAIVWGVLTFDNASSDLFETHKTEDMTGILVSDQISFRLYFELSIEVNYSYEQIKILSEEYYTI